MAGLYWGDEDDASVIDFSARADKRGTVITIKLAVTGDFTLDHLLRQLRAAQPPKKKGRGGPLLLTDQRFGGSNV